MKDREKLKSIIVAANQKEKEKEYWLNKLSGDLKKSRFPYDYKSGALFVNAKEKQYEEQPLFEIVDFRFSPPLISKLMEMSKGSHYTMNIILQAVLVVLLGKYSGSSDIIIGSSIFKQEAGRDQRVE
jgi:surfactin family lipopeptide synthetase A